MKKPLVALVVVVVIIIGAFAVLALTGNKDQNDTGSMADMDMNTNSNTSNNDSSSTQPISTNKVEIKNFVFSPSSITVKVGTKVTWTNKDSTAHTVTADTSSADAPSSDQLGTGQSYSFTFTKAGTYAYHCELHPNMTAKVVVTE
jgi:plastocyanin